MRDFQNVSHHLIGGGFMVFDDSADHNDWGSRLTAQEAANHTKSLPRIPIIDCGRNGEAS
jgi:hypothetical protein